MSYRTLKRRFDLNDDDLEDLKDELIAAKQLASDEDGKVLVWTGRSVASLPTVYPAQTHLPAVTPSPPEAERRQLTVYVGAIGHLSRGLEVLVTLPESPEWAQQELLLHSALSTALTATRGYAAPEASHAYGRVRELCQQMGETPQLFRILHALRIFYLIRAEFQTARQLGEQLLSLSQSAQKAAFLPGAHESLGTTLFYIGFYIGELAIAACKYAAAGSQTSPLAGSQ